VKLTVFFFVFLPTFVAYGAGCARS